MRKLLIPIVALLAFSMLCTSISAGILYYMASFYGEASGSCVVCSELGPEAVGKGSVHIRGLAIVREHPSYYWANTTDPNTRIWTRRTCMTVSWNNEKLMIFMWPSHTAMGYFNDTMNWFYVLNLTYFGYYMGDVGLQFLSGKAHVICRIDPIPSLEVALYTDTVFWVSFVWLVVEYMGWPAARHITRSVSVWGPIPWHPSGP